MAVTPLIITVEVVEVLIITLGAVLRQAHVLILQVLPGADGAVKADKVMALLAVVTEEALVIHAVAILVVAVVVALTVAVLVAIMEVIAVTQLQEPVLSNMVAMVPMVVAVGAQVAAVVIMAAAVL